MAALQFQPHQSPKESGENDRGKAAGESPNPILRLLLLPLTTLDRLGRGVLWLIARGWKLIVSPWMPPACRFEPTCSDYAAEAVRVHPFPKALVLIIWRLWRCSPAYDGGYDQVPLRGEWPARLPFKKNRVKEGEEEPKPNNSATEPESVRESETEKD